MGRGIQAGRGRAWGAIVVSSARPRAGSGRRAGAGRQGVWMGEALQIVVEPRARRRRGRVALSGKKKAAALFRVWHGLSELIREAERLGDGEMVHFLAVAQLLVEEKAASLVSTVALLDTASRPN